MQRTGRVRCLTGRAESHALTFSSAAAFAAAAAAITADCTLGYEGALCDVDACEGRFGRMLGSFPPGMATCCS